jgi:hypothetical protein
MRVIFIFLLNCIVVHSLYSESFKETFLIRRVFLDVIDRSPTPEEVDWLCVYHTNSYEKAVDYVLNDSEYKWNTNKQAARHILLSREYKERTRILLSEDEKIKIILFLNGFSKKLQPNNISIDRCYSKMIESALACTYNISDAIDYIANLLLCRTTSVTEINILLKQYNNSINEHTGWYNVINCILEFDDFKTR